MTHDSLRFAGKNEILLQYTVDWACKEIEDDCDIWLVYSEGMPKKRCFGVIHDIYCPPEIKDDHKEIMRWCVEYISWQGGQEDDGFIALQTTQPRRRKGLLRDCVQVLGNVDKDTVIVSYCLQDDMSWRLVDKGTLDRVGERSDDLHKYYDGALYAWTGNNSDLIFDLPNAKKCWLYNGRQYVCDIDYKWQYDCFVGTILLIDLL